MFAAVAQRYDLLNHLLSAGIDRRWRRRTVRLVSPATDGPLASLPVLDVCTGTGDLAIEYARAIEALPGTSAVVADRPCPEVPRDGARGLGVPTSNVQRPASNVQQPTPRVIGTDFCEPMLRLGREKVRRAGMDGRVELIEADTLRLPFPDESFQIVSVAFGLRNVADTDAGLAEMARVCHRGGHVAVLEFSTPQVWPIRSLYLWYFRHVLPRIGQAVASSPDAAYNYLPDSVGEFDEGEALAGRMRRVGLRNVEFHRFTLGIATLYVGEK